MDELLYKHTYFGLIDCNPHKTVSMDSVYVCVYEIGVRVFECVCVRAYFRTSEAILECHTRLPTRAAAMLVLLVLRRV